MREASAFAANAGATLDLVYVDPLAPVEELHDPTLRGIVARHSDEIRERERSDLEGLAALVPEPNRGRIVQAAGRPADEIVRLGAGYDAILVATHGRTGLEHFFLGSVAERVVRRASVPVLVLRLPEGADARR